MRRASERILSKLLYVPVGLMIVMVLSEISGIAGRMMRLQVSGSTELTSYIGAVFISVCIFYVTLKNGNVSVSFFVGRLHGRKRAVFALITALLSMFAVGLLIWAGYQYASKMEAADERSLLLNLRIAYVRYVFVLGLSLALGVLVKQLFEALSDLIRR